MPNLTALVDADNFYVSCERLFNPGLRQRPVLVLSNNDGCVVARSQEVKDLGIKMGTPRFQIKHLTRAHGISVFSSNYELYGDISARLMNILSGFSPATEVYSIDEAFLQLKPEGVTETCARIISTCRDWLSIPVKIGVARSKTLAKVASELVKRQKMASRFIILDSKKQIRDGLARLEIENIWGIGSRTAEKLRSRGIRTPLELADTNETYARKNFGVGLARTIMELRGRACFKLETRPQPQKNMCCSRSFGRPVSDYQELREAVSCYAAEAAAKLRRHKLKTRSVGVFIVTDRFKPSAPQYINSCCQPLPAWSNDTRPIVQQALQGLARIFKPGYNYRKSGILLNDLIPEVNQPADWFQARDSVNQSLSQAIDTINRRFGANTIAIGASGTRKTEPEWAMSRRHRSPRYTTQWRELLPVR